MIGTMRGDYQVRCHRRRVLAVDNPVAVDIFRAAVARTEVTQHLLEVGLVHGPVTVHVPRAG